MNNDNNVNIQKAEIGYTIANLDTKSYINLSDALLKDFSKFKNIPVAPDKYLKKLSILKKRHRSFEKP